MKIDRDKYRANLTRYTRRALQALPELNHPKILDIGCGSGVPSLELARFTNGKIIGVDHDAVALKKFKDKAIEAGYGNRIETMHISMEGMPFKDETFDIVWSEGSIAFIGFEKGLDEWKRLVKPGGFIVIHDELGNIDKKKQQIREAGYFLLDHFILNENIWWDEYYEHLRKELGEHYEDGALTLEGEALEIFKEIEMYHKEPERNRSVYFVLQKPKR